jgi:hypothetical protein
VDYQGRSFLHPPQDVGVNLRSDAPPDKCFLPKAHIHTWQGHTKGISAMRWFPGTAHLLLTCSMDGRVKVTYRQLPLVVIPLFDNNSTVVILLVCIVVMLTMLRERKTIRNIWQW